MKLSDKTIKVVKVIGTRDGQKVEFPTDGVFVFIENLLPNTGFLKDSSIDLDEVRLVKPINIFRQT